MKEKFTVRRDFPCRTRATDFALVWAASVISAIGTRMLGVVYPLLALAMTGSPAAVGLTGFVLTIPILVLYVPGGVLVDRIPPRRVLLFAESVRALTVVSVGVALSVGGPSLGHIVLAALLEGGMWVLHSLAGTSLMPSLVRPDKLRGAVAKTESTNHLASLAGRPLGGLLFGLGFFVPFIVNAVLFTLAYVLSLGVRAQPRKGPAPLPLRRSLLEGFRILASQPFLRASVVLITITNLMVNALIMLFVAGSGDLTPLTVGIVLGLAGVGGTLGGLSAAYIKPRRFMLLIHMWVWVMALSTAAVGAFLLHARPAFFAMALFITGFVGALSNVSIKTMEVECVAPDMLARVVGAARLSSHGAVCLSAPLGGLLVTWCDVSGGSVVLLVAMTCVAVAGTAMRGFRRSLIPPSAQQHV
ncbi:MFS transporter [Nonomuraea sp. B1E8]|uniref:MFS transporter n=1 Tax=unclassified Nonomuraea TaxID=2593643 RepID=UPI00325E832B